MEVVIGSTTYRCTFVTIMYRSALNKSYSSKNTKILYVNPDEVLSIEMN